MCDSFVKNFKEAHVNIYNTFRQMVHQPSHSIPVLFQMNGDAFL